MLEQEQQPLPASSEPEMSKERLAALTDFEDSTVARPDAPNRRVDPDSGTSEMSPEEIEAEITRHTFASSPLVKLGFVAIGVLGIVLVGGAFIHALTGGGLWSKKHRPPVQKFTQEVAKSQPPDKEKGDVLTTLAIEQQEDALSRVNPPVETEKKSTVPKKIPTVPVPHRPRTRYIPPPSPQPIVRQVISRPVVPSPRQIAASPPDPYQQWLVASRAGAYGATTPTSPTSNLAESKTTDETRDRPDDSNTLVASLDPAVSQPISEKAIPIGTRATARLERSLAFTDGQNEASPMRVVIRLSSPLLNAMGFQILPAGTQLVTELDSSEAPLVVLKPIAFLLVQNGRYVEFLLPDGALAITGKEAEPLVAKSKRVNRGGGRNDIPGAVLGVLSEAGRAVDIPAADIPVRVYRRLDRDRHSPAPVRASHLYTLAGGIDLEIIATQSFTPFDYAEPQPSSSDAEPSPTSTRSKQMPAATDDRFTDDYSTPYTP